MPASKTSPRIDEALCRRILKLKHTGATFAGLASYLEEQRLCWSAQSHEDGLPRSIATNTRLLRQERAATLKSLRQTVQLLEEAGHDPKVVFASLGLASPAELASFDDARLSSEVQRLCSSLGRKPQLRACVSLNLRVRAEKMNGRLVAIGYAQQAMAAAPKQAAARVKRWHAALAKLRKSAERAGVKVHGL